MITLDRDIKQPVDPELLLDELRRRARQADERVGLDVMEVAGDHEQVERVAELAVRERAQAVGGDDRVGRARAGDDDRERVLPPVGEGRQRRRRSCTPRGPGRGRSVRCRP